MLLELSWYWWAACNNQYRTRVVEACLATLTAAPLQQEGFALPQALAPAANKRPRICLRELLSYAWRHDSSATCHSHCVLAECCCCLCRSGWAVLRLQCFFCKPSSRCGCISSSAISATLSQPLTSAVAVLSSIHLFFFFMCCSSCTAVCTEVLVLQATARRQPLRIQAARVAGVDIPNQKRVEFSLRYIYGIGPTTSKAIMASSV